MVGGKVSEFESIKHKWRLCREIFRGGVIKGRVVEGGNREIK